MNPVNRRIYNSIYVTLISLSCLALLIVLPVRAQDSDSCTVTSEAEQAFNRGDYRQASYLAEAEEDFDLAIRAAMVYGGFYAADVAEASEWLNRAHKVVDIALEIDPSDLRNRVSLAMILSYKAKKIKSIGLVTRAKRILEILVTDYPDEVMPQGALAGWHSEISAAGFFPRLILGGSRKKARHHFEKALALDNSKMPLNLEYAKFLARGGDKERRMAENQLLALLEAELHNAFERLLHDNARAILIAVQSGSKRKIKLAIAEKSAFQDF